MNGTIHIIGLGLAGLSAAVRMVEKGYKPLLYEGAKVAGGRCRSYHDTRLDCLIDNGNHLLLSGNKSALSYLDLLDAQHELNISKDASFSFVDLKDQERWTVTMNEGLIPWWVFQKAKSIPGVQIGEFKNALRFPFARKDATITDLTGEDGALFDRFWEPMTWAVLNITPEKASARLMWSVFRETFAKGGAACRPMVAKRGLSETFIDPALNYLSRHDIKPRFNEPLKQLEIKGNQVTALHIGDDHLELAEDDRVILALPRAQAARLLPTMPLPDGDSSIINAHFKVSGNVIAQKLEPITGLINSKTHWIFVRDNIISLTISAADSLGLDRLAEEELLPVLWKEVCQALILPKEATYEKGRLIRERRATFNQTPDSVSRRPKTKSNFTNMVFAGDWTDTGLPATIEGSIRSGEMAAKALLHEL